MKKEIVPPNAMLYSFAKKKLDLKKKVKKLREKKNSCFWKTLNAFLI